MICSNCGADIGDNETACPYCGAMQYENSEQKLSLIHISEPTRPY